MKIMKLAGKVECTEQEVQTAAHRADSLPQTLVTVGLVM